MRGDQECGHHSSARPGTLHPRIPRPGTGHHHTQVKLSTAALPWPWLITMHHQPQQPPARHLTASLQPSHHQELGSCCVHSVRCPHPPGCPGDLVLVTRSPCPHLHCPHTTAWCTMCTVHSPVLYTLYTIHSSWLAAILGHWS